jgi:predicted PurR-regulated permease PerM
VREKIMELDRKTTRTIAGLLAFAIVLYLGLSNWKVVVGVLIYVYNLLFPFILGGCIAFILNIPMSFFTKKLSNVKDKTVGPIIRKGNKVISLILSFIMIIGIIALISYIVIPQIITTAKILPATFENAVRSLQKWAENREWLSTGIVNWVNTLHIDWESMLNNAKSIVFSGASSMLLSTIGVATSFANGIVNFLLGLVFAFYILLQKEKLGAQCKKALYAFLPKEKADSVLGVAALTSETFSNFISGQCLEAVILGLMFFVTMIIFKFPYALVISVLIGVTALIPVLGSFIGCAIGIFLIVMVNPVQAGLFLILFLVLQQIEGNVVYPRVVGDSVGLPAIWVLVAITIGGKMMGVAGMIIFIPLFSVAYVLFKKEVYNRLKKKNIKIA